MSESPLSTHSGSNPRRRASSYRSDRRKTARLRNCNISPMPSRSAVSWTGERLRKRTDRVLRTNLRTGTFCLFNVGRMGTASWAVVAVGRRDDPSNCVHGGRSDGLSPCPAALSRARRPRARRRALTTPETPPRAITILSRVESMRELRCRGSRRISIRIGGCHRHQPERGQRAPVRCLSQVRNCWNSAAFAAFVKLPGIPELD